VAEAAVPDVQVENDSLVFKGQTIMNKQRTAKAGPQPGQIPAPVQIGKDVLYSPHNYIPTEKTNKKDATSKGTIEYLMAAGSINTEEEELEYEIHGINTVTVHTPVVNYSAVSDDQPHNQKTKPDMTRSALILDRPFTVRIPTSGQHLDAAEYPGYGNRDYAKYFRTKQVRFPFDVYNESKSQFIPKDNWIDVPVDQLDTTFYLPVWVDEGDYQVYFRNIAENAPFGYSWEQDANLDLANHAAVDQVSVQVIGRLYDFHITDIGDYNWERVFRAYAGSKDASGVSYWVGQNGIDGDPRGNKEPYTLPIRPGSNPLTGMKNVAVKQGYYFHFDFKTMGNMFSQKDGIRITPTFSYVSKEGGTPIPVDLYYQTNDQPLVKIGSPEDKVQRYVILNDWYRNVSMGDLKNAAYWHYDEYLTPEEKAGQDRELFMRNYVLKYAKKKTPVGGYSKLLLPEQLKTLIGPKEIPMNASVTPERANASIQRWFGEYSIPADTLAVAQGTNLAEVGRLNGGLTKKSPVFLKDGYIVVNFNIESIQNGNLQAPHLQYINAPLMNQWRLEGYRPNILDSYLKIYHVKDGDVVFYNADQSSRDDFSAQAPH
ncbi:bacterial surface protein, partial [Paenibacillus sp. ES5-4]